MTTKKTNGVSIDLPNGVTVHCPEDGGAIQNPVTVEFNGAAFTCHDARSLVNAISMTLAQYLVSGRKQGGGKQGSGPERAWADAREYARNFNKGKPESEHITDDDARRLLARDKKQQQLEAALKSRPPQKPKK